MTRKILVSGAALLAALAIAPATQAATVSYEGSTLVYTGDGSEVNDVIASEGTEPNTIRFYEYAGASFSGAADKCQVLYGYYECQTPTAMKWCRASWLGRPRRLAMGWTLLRSPGPISPAT